MAQGLIVYAIVAAAAGWTVWRLFLRGRFKQKAKAKAVCAPGCACSDG